MSHDHHHDDGHPSEGADPHLKPVGPFITYAIGISLSLIVLIVTGIFGAFVYSVFSGNRLEDSYPGFWIIGWACALSFYGSGLRDNSGKGYEIPVGYYGVPTWLGKRIDRVHVPFLSPAGSRCFLRWDNLLSEGYHWMPPWMGAIPVNHKIQTSSPVEVQGYSLGPNPIHMMATMIYKFRITRPYVWLDAMDELVSLERLGSTKYRDAIARHTADDLIKDEVSAPIAKEVEHALKQVSDDEYGIGIIQVLDPNMRMPPEVDKALEKERIALAEQAEKIVRAQTFRRQLDIVTADGGPHPDVGAQVVLAQNDQAKINYNVTRFEGDKEFLSGVKSIIVEGVKAFKGEKETQP